MERAGFALICGLALAAAGCDARGNARAGAPVPGEDGDRVTAEVLNASGVAGSARGATRHLRRAGIDVVYYGNAPAEAGQLDTTRIVVRRGSRDAGERVRRALGVGRVVNDPDSGRLLDVSVFLGTDFRPPREFDP